MVHDVYDPTGLAPVVKKVERGPDAAPLTQR